MRKIQKISTETFDRKLEYRVKHNLCLHCGKRPCVCGTKKQKNNRNQNDNYSSIGLFAKR